MTSLLVRSTATLAVGLLLFVLLVAAGGGVPGSPEPAETVTETERVTATATTTETVEREIVSTVTATALRTVTRAARAGSRTAPKSPTARGVWDRLAECESSGDWSANTGNGYFGGLQFMASTWRMAGGERYASRADLATREQQIEIAAGWLARTDWAQWPVCSKRIGVR